MTNRHNYTTLAEGIRAAGQVSNALQQSLLTRSLETLENAEDFDVEKFTAHALSECPINPQRIIRNLQPIDGYARAVVTCEEVPVWAFGAYLSPAEGAVFFNRYAIIQLGHEMRDTNTWEIDEDDNLLIVGADSANDFADPDADDKIDVIRPNDDGLYCVTDLTTWKVVG